MPKFQRLLFIHFLILIFCLYFFLLVSSALYTSYCFPYSLYAYCGFLQPQFVVVARFKSKCLQDIYHAQSTINNSIIDHSFWYSFKNQFFDRLVKIFAFPQTPQNQHRNTLQVLFFTMMTPEKSVRVVVFSIICSFITVPRGFVSWTQTVNWLFVSRHLSNSKYTIKLS